MSFYSKKKFVLDTSFWTFLCAILLCFVLASITGCSKPEPRPLPILRIGHAPHDHHAPLYIAAMNPDFFRDNGGVYLKEIAFRSEYLLIKDKRELARVFIDSSTGGKKLIRTLDERHNDITFGGLPAMLTYIDQGSEMEILLPVMTEGAGLVVTKDMPVANWDEFITYVGNRDEPVRIGYKTAVSNQNLTFETALKTMSIPFVKSGEKTNGAKVVLVNLFGAKNLIPAMQNNVIDGFVVNQPFVAMAEQQGVGKMIASLSELPPAGKWKNSPCCALAGNKSYVAKNPEVVENLLTMLLKANRFITQNSEKSAQQVAEWLGINPDVERLSLPTIKYITEYNEDWHRGVNFWVESMVEAGKLNKNVKEAHEQGKLDKTVYNMEPYTKAQKNM